LPDISASLQAVRNYRLTRENDPTASFEARLNRPKAGSGKRPSQRKSGSVAKPKSGSVKQPKVPKSGSEGPTKAGQ